MEKPFLHEEGISKREQDTCSKLHIKNYAAAIKPSPQSCIHLAKNILPYTSFPSWNITHLVLALQMHCLSLGNFNTLPFTFRMLLSLNKNLPQFSFLNPDSTK